MGLNHFQFVSKQLRVTREHRYGDTTPRYCIQYLFWLLPKILRKLFLLIYLAVLYGSLWTKRKFKCPT